LARTARGAAHGAHADLYGAAFDRWLADGSVRSARIVVPLVFELLQPERVVDVGCGVGGWLAEFKRLGASRVIGIDGSDIAPSLLLVGSDEFVRHDLSQPLPNEGERFDLAIALEVAEHLPASAGDQLVKSLTRLAPAVLFSAAVPHQGGVGHVNEQWPEYWAERFKGQGFRAVDCLRDQIWANPDVEFWYAQNLLLYVSEELLGANARITEAAAQADGRPLARIHPEAYLAKAKAARRWYRSPSVVSLLKRAPARVRARPWLRRRPGQETSHVERPSRQ